MGCSQLLRLTCFSRRLAVVLPWPDRGRRRPLLTEPCDDTGEVGCFGPLFLMPYCWCGTTFHMPMRVGEFLVVRPTMCARAIRCLWS